MTAWEACFADVARTRLTYAKREGDRARNGRTGVVMLHGQLGIGSVVIPLVEDVDDRKVLVPDIRGRGASVCAEASRHTWSQYAEDVFALMDAEGVDRAVVAGVSFGAGVAITCALARPERVDGLVLWSSPYAGADAGWSPAQRAVQEPVFRMAETVLAHGFEAAMEERVADAPDVDAKDLRARWSRHDPTSLATAIVSVGWNQPFPSTSTLAALTMPAVVLAGDEALHPREVSDAYIAAIPAVREAEVGRATVSSLVRDVGRGRYRFP